MKMRAAFRGGARPDRSVYAVALLIAFLLRFTSVLCGGEASNLIVNGDFSKSSNGRPDQWQAAGDSSVVTQSLSVGKDADGTSYGRLECTRCDRQAPASHAMLAQVGAVSLVKGKTYEFSCRARAEGLAGRTVSLAITDTKSWTNCGLESQLALDSAWKTHKRVFRATRDVGSTSRLQMWFNEPGTLCVADVRLVEVRTEDVRFTDVVADAGRKNLIFNSSFEVGTAGWSSLGTGVGWGDVPWLHGRIEEGGGEHGRSFLRIPVGGEQAPVLYFDYYDSVARRELRPLAASKRWMKLDRGVAYTLSCFLRASREGVPGVLGARTQDPTGPWREHKAAIKLSTAWTRHALTFRPEEAYAFVYVGPDLAEEQLGHVDVDGVQLEKGEGATAYEPRTEIEFGVVPSERGGIFYDSQPASLVLRGCNHGSSAVSLAVNFRVTDFDDKPVALPRQTLQIPERSNVQRKVAMPGEWRGFYRVVAEGDGAGGRDLAELRLAIVPQRASTDSVLGINHAFVSADLIHLAAKAGVAWYRDWSLRWQQIEPVKGQFRWDISDLQIDRVLRERVSVLPLLPPFPSADWASEAPADLPTRGYPGVRLRQAWGPKDPRDLGAFIEQAVARYKDRIRIWEFLNEPIYTDYSLPADSTGRYGGRRYSAGDYVRLLETAAQAMRKGDPTCKVIGGIGSGPRHLTEEVMEAGILKHIDILNLHMYPGIRPPEAYAPEMDRLLALFDQHGGRKPVWITEFSYYASDELPRDPFYPSESAWAEQRLLDSEKQCADYTVRYFVVMLSRGVQKIFIHSGANGRVNEPNYECALFADEGAPRKLFAAMAVLTRLLGGSPACVGDRRVGQGAWCVGFETGEQSLLVLWQAGEQGGDVLALPSGNGLRWVDAMGVKLGGPPKQLSGSPVYLLGPVGGAKEILGSIAAAGTR